MLHIAEWDLLFCESLESMYKHIPRGVGLTGLIPLKKVEDKWDWTSKDPSKAEWHALLAWAKEKYQYTGEPFACLGPGACLSKEFLSKFSAIDVPEFGNDELRLPLFCQILKMPMYDTEFYKAWFSSEERRYFNCRNEDIGLETIKEELSNPHGRRVFHPYRKVYFFS